MAISDLFGHWLPTAKGFAEDVLDPEGIAVRLEPIDVRADRLDQCAILVDEIGAAETGSNRSGFYQATVDVQLLLVTNIDDRRQRLYELAEAVDQRFRRRSTRWDLLSMAFGPAPDEQGNVLGDFANITYQLDLKD